MHAARAEVVATVHASVVAAAWWGFGLGWAWPRVPAASWCLIQHPPGPLQMLQQADRMEAERGQFIETLLEARRASEAALDQIVPTDPEAEEQLSMMQEYLKAK